MSEKSRGAVLQEVRCFNHIERYNCCRTLVKVYTMSANQTKFCVNNMANVKSNSEVWPLCELRSNWVAQVLSQIPAASLFFLSMA